MARTLHECQKWLCKWYDVHHTYFTHHRVTWYMKKLVNINNNRISRINRFRYPCKTAYTGISASNINGYTMNNFLDVPLEMNEGNGTLQKKTLGCR